MRRFSFQAGTESKKKPTVLLWRLPKPAVTVLPTAPQHENLKPRPRPFGRRVNPAAD